MRRGFSLVELMIVVAIAAILAAIAIPRYERMQYQAKRAEVAPNVDAIRLAQLGYDAANEIYLQCEPAPRTRTEMDAQAIPFTYAADTGWPVLGWSPDGLVRGVYETDPDAAEGFVVQGASDVDDNGLEAIYRATRDNTVYLVSPEHYY